MNRGLERVLVTSLGVIVVLVATLALSPAWATVEQGPSRECMTSAPTGLVSDSHPVVMVHGWTDGPKDMQRMRTMLQKDSVTGNGWQYLLFDYEHAAAQWASSPDIAYCLGDFLLAVSRSHRDAGGDGIVYVVAHSMGGLATRYATAAATLGDGRFAIGPPGVADILGGVVTLDTPHTGSPWGNTGFAKLKELGDGLAFSVPWGRSRARECLAPHRVGPALVTGCGPVAPHLPLTVPIHQIAGHVTIERWLFGLLAYEVPLAGDSIVPTDSQHGYVGSASGATAGQSVSFDTVSCTAPDGVVRAVAAKLGLRWRGFVNSSLAHLFVDHEALGAINDGTPSMMLALLLTVNYTAPCSHLNITSNADAAMATGEALKRMADGRPQPDDLCTSRRIATDLGEEANSILTEQCEGEWAIINDGSGIGDGGRRLLQHSGDQWSVLTGYPASLCRETASAQGAPDWVLDTLPETPCQARAPAEVPEEKSGTECGTVSLTHGRDDAVVIVATGPVDCDFALELVDSYYNENYGGGTGSSGYQRFDDWACESTSAAGYRETGQMGGCFWTTDGAFSGGPSILIRGS